VYDLNDKCIGMIDVLDCAHFVTDLYFSNKDNSQFKNYLLQFSFDVEKVQSVMDFSRKNPFYPVSLDTKLSDVLEKFADGIHRVPVLENEKVIFMLTQMTLLRAIDELGRCSDWFQKIKDKTVQELNIGIQDKNSIQAVNVDSLAIDAFKNISDQGVSAVGILDRNNKLIGVLSASDLQGFLGEELIHLGSNVIDFINFARKKKELAGESTTPRDYIVFIKNSDSFEQVIDRFLQTKVHRLFIMNNDHL